jgi:YaaC-like protein
VPSLSAPREGVDLAIKGRDVAFSFFPVRFRHRGWTLSDTVFAVSPWAVMQGAVDERLRGAARSEASAFLDQARDFYVTASERLAANPLLFYYAFLNLGKAVLRVRGLQGSLDRAHHGLAEDPNATTGSLQHAALCVRRGGNRVHVFPALFDLLEDQIFTTGDKLPVADLLAQVVVGHRQWRDAADAGERFIPLVDIDLMHDRHSRALWARLYADQQDLERFGLSVRKLMTEARLNDRFRHVQSPKPGYVCLELASTTTYATDPADDLAAVVAAVRPVLWRIASALPGGAYRRYYLHLTPTRRTRISQLAALWALWFYFGSVVRYRPHVFAKMTAGRYGAYITEFIAAQPEQLLYLLASEMCEREVAKPAIA